MKWEVICINKEGRTEVVAVDVANSTEAMSAVKKLKKGYKPIRVKASAPASA